MISGKPKIYDGENSLTMHSNVISETGKQTTRKTTKPLDAIGSNSENKGFSKQIETLDWGGGAKKDKSKTTPNIPNIPNSLYSSLPDFFKRVIKYADDNDEKDILLLSSIVTTGSCLSNIYGEYHDMKIHPNLNLFVTGAASSGKSRIKFSRKLVEPIHKELRQKTLTEKEEYNNITYSIGNNNKKKNEPQKVKDVPVQRMLIIPGNATSSRVQEILHNNDGKGLIFETEGDVMLNSFKSDYGDYSTVFRQSFHHEQISLSRKGNDEHIEINNPKLSVVLSGTPMQLNGLIPNAENGLFSRFMFYKIKTKSAWMDVFKNKVKGGLENHFESLGDEFHQLHKNLESREEIEFKFTSDQEVKFNNFFRNNSEKYRALLGNDFISCLRRIAVIGFRTAMILSFFRVQEKKNLPDKIICENIDFKNTLSILDIILTHSALVFSQTPKAPRPRVVKTKEQELLELLPLEFTRQGFYACAEKLNTSKKGADKLISKLTKSEWIQRKSHGEYVNASKLDPVTESRI